MYENNTPIKASMEKDEGICDVKYRLHPHIRTTSPRNIDFDVSPVRPISFTDVCSLARRFSTIPRNMIMHVRTLPKTISAHGSQSDFSNNIRKRMPMARVTRPGNRKPDDWHSSVIIYTSGN